MLFTFNLDLNRRLNFKEFVLFKFKLIDLKNIFCISIIISPIPNSTADSIKKKKVRDNKLVLLNIKPSKRVVTYKVIHKNSAVKRRCRDVLTFTTILRKIKKKIINKKFRSPKDIKYTDQLKHYLNCWKVK